MKTIMFNEMPYGLHAAVLCGRKTATRRVVPYSHLSAYNEYKDKTYMKNEPLLSLNDFLIKRGYAKYIVGEEVALAQSYQSLGLSPTMTIKVKSHDKKSFVSKPISETAGWNNKMFVHSDYMLHSIVITSVRVEPLSHITEEGCRQEGIIRMDAKGVGLPPYYTTHPGGESIGSSYRDAFGNLINKLAHKDIASRNPYVYVYEFRLVK